MWITREQIICHCPIRHDNCLFIDLRENQGSEARNSFRASDKEKGIAMNPYVISAKFAAYVWYEHQNPQKSALDAMSFARQNWNTFLPYSHKGVGRLLAKIAEPKCPSVVNPVP